MFTSINFGMFEIENEFNFCQKRKTFQLITFWVFHANIFMKNGLG